MSETETKTPPAKRPPRPEVVVRRMTRVDLDELGNWLLGRLQKVYPGETPAVVMGWLRGACESNEYYFVRTPLAVALVQIVKEPLRPPRAEERFVFEMEKGIEQAANLYHNIKQFCVNAGLDEYTLSGASDVEENRIEIRLGKLRPVPLRYAVIDIPVPV